MPLPRRREIDRVVYPISDDMGEHELQTLMRETLRPLLARLLASKGLDAHAGSDQFIYWEKGNPAACVAPDAYVLPGVPQSRVIASWKTWEERNIVPSLAIEIVTGDVQKDYEEAPARYDALGVRELVIYDTRLDPAPRRIRRWRFQIYRRTAGRFVRILATDEDRVRLRSLDAWLRVVGEGMERRLRLATGSRGTDIVPTSDEEAHAEAQAAHAEAHAAHAEAHAARMRAEAERARADRLEAALREALKSKPKRAR